MSERIPNSGTASAPDSAPASSSAPAPAPGSATALAPKTRIRRRTVVAFLVTLLVVLSAASFASIALGWGKTSAGVSDQELGEPTQLASTDPFYILLIGSDTLEGTALYTADMSRDPDYAPHADAITLMRVDPAALTLTLVSVPADTVLQDYNLRLRDSLAEGGPEETTYLVERLTGVSIGDYFLIDYAAFEALVNQVGSIKVDVPQTLVEQDPLTAKKITVKEGNNQKLDGAHALAYVRASEQYPADVAAHRQHNVREVEAAIISQVFSLDDAKVRAALGVFESGVETSMSNQDLLALVTRFYSNKEQAQVFSCTGPYLTTGIDVEGRPFIRTSPNVWRELMTIVDAGENPADYPQYTFGS